MTALGTPTILLVDDEPAILDSLQAGLKRGLPGARIVVAQDGIAGLEALAREPFDIILSDNCMPNMQGIEFLIHSRRVAPSAKRMMLTAYPDPHLLQRNVNEAHIHHFFTKPFKLLDVLTVLREALSEQRERAARDLALARAIEEVRTKRPPISMKHVPEPFRGPL